MTSARGGSGTRSGRGGLVVGALAISVVLPAVAVPARAQATPASVPCDGRIVSRVEIRPSRPQFEGIMSRWRHVARAIGLHHTTTDEDVIAAFLALHAGEPCTELRRAESERVLRAQPFLAAASVRTIPDGPGRAAVFVETRDEAPVLANASFHGIHPVAFALGNDNIGGQALHVEARVSRGYNSAYRTAFGGRATEYATFGRPYVATIEGERQTVGYWVSTTLEHPFFTDLQHIGWHLGYGRSRGYPGIIRPAQDPLVLGVHTERWDASSITRLFGTRTVALAGFGVSGIRVVPDSMGTVLGATGPVPDTGVTLRGRYQSFRAGRVGVLGGLRRLTFHTVRGFDALTAEQDVASGVMSGQFVAHGIAAFGESDFYLSNATYAGMATDRTLLAGMTELEGTRPMGQGQWESVIGSARGAFYAGQGPGLLFLLDDRYSFGVRPRLPMQLWLGDWDGGMLGYHSSTLAGGRRNVARAEVRWSGAALVRNADVGLATFTQLGTVWAGDAPYGADATRASVGLSVMAAYPTGSKRLYRADVGFAVSRRDGTGRGIEVRFTSEDRTQSFWREPDDVRRSRTGATPSSLFAWPAR